MQAHKIHAVEGLDYHTLSKLEMHLHLNAFACCSRSPGLGATIQVDGFCCNLRGHEPCACHILL